MKTPSEKARNTAKWARTMTKWLASYSQRSGAKWRLVDFNGKSNAESRGIVDMIAIRKNHRLSLPDLKRGDLFDIILIQVKGGSARWPSDEDIRRLSQVARHHKAKAVILAEWQKGKSPQLYQLIRRRWQAVDAKSIFN